MLDLDNIQNYYTGREIAVIQRQLAAKKMRLARKAERGFFVIVRVAGELCNVWSTN